jgi:uncharacterized alkaline shock family protein YloU
MRQRPVTGKSFVTRRAIFDIVRSAVQSSYGVTGFSDPSLGRRLLRLVGLDRPGIKLQTEGGLALELYLKVAYGMPVAEVARQVDSAVRYELRRMIGAEVASLTIHVDGLGYQPTAIQHAEAIERGLEGEAIELAEPNGGPAEETPARDQARKTAARGEKPGKRTRTR